MGNTATPEQEVSPKTSVRAISTPLLVSIIVFVWVILLAIGLSILDATTVSSIEWKRESIADYSAKIAELHKDPSIVSMELVKNNKSSIEKTIERSRAQNLIGTLFRLKRDYSVEFSGFSYTEGKLSTTIAANADSIERNPAIKVARFIGDFRGESGTASGSMLSLSPISNVAWDDTSRTFPAEFILK